MSESEKKKRLAYRKKRKRLIFVQSAIAIVLVLAIAVFGTVFFKINNDYHVNYTEQNSIDYKVYLKENDFYEEEFLGKDQIYVASLIKSVEADFNYSFAVDAESTDYEVTYGVVGKLIISEKSSGTSIFEKDYVLKEDMLLIQSGSNIVNINEKITVDYDEYNDIANDFVGIYDLSDASSVLKLTMVVNLSGKCQGFDITGFDNHAFSLNIPLTQKTVNIVMTSTVPQNVNSVMTFTQGVDKDVFKSLTIISAVLLISAVIVLIAFIYLTRNYDINYEIKIKRLVSAYKSYVQRILTEFCTDGYQILKIETFNEMLDIRDTLNMPILMSENLDKTCTKFLLPTSNKILYEYEIKVDDYDEIYGNNTDLYESAKEEVSVTASVNEVETPSPFGNLKYDYSFVSKLHLASDDTRKFYTDIISFVRSYGLKVNRSWNRERIYIGRKTYALLTFKGFKLTVSFALNPADYVETKYKLVDVSAVKKYNNTPAQMKITSARKSVWVKELLTSMLKADGVESQNIMVKVENIKPKKKSELIKKNLIKVG